VTPSWVARRLAVRDEEELKNIVRECAFPPYLPVGSEAHLGRGRPPERPVTLLSLTALDRIVEHAREDFTVTVEAGVATAALRTRLAESSQWIPALEGMEGTVGGVVACDRRGVLAGALGSMHDALLGIRFVDARGDAVQGGGRVVKNVAGYNLMRLATGSLGAVGAIVEVTLRTRSRPESWGAVEWADPSDVMLGEAVREAPAWDPLALLRFDLGEGDRLLALFAGSRTRVAAQVERARSRWGTTSRVLSPEEARELPGIFAAYARPEHGPVGWGGALPGHLASRPAPPVIAEGAWWGDLLQGHVGWCPPAPPAPQTLARLRAWFADGQGHLHLDVPRSAGANPGAWDRRREGEEALWGRLRTALDPDRVWAYGRLPGEAS